MTLTIRPAESHDVATILGFIRELAAFERQPDAVEATEPMLQEALFGHVPVAEALVAEREGALLGFALFYHTFSTWTGRRGIWLDDLYVSPEARGCGAGKALLQRIAKIAMERGCARFEWWVLDWNAAAIAVYDSIGAETMSDWTVRRFSGEALVRLAGVG